MNRMVSGSRVVLLAGVLVTFALTAQAADDFNLVIKDHRFEPAELVLPAGQKVKIRIDNQDPTPEEFESYDLNREKVIGGKSQAVVFVGPLKPGTYKYFGEFNPTTAQGLIVVREA